MRKRKAKNIFGDIPKEELPAVQALHEAGTERDNKGRRLSPKQIYLELRSRRLLAEFAAESDRVRIEQKLRRIREQGLDNVAKLDFERAICHLFGVLNLTESGDVPWSLPQKAKDRAEDLLMELIALFHETKLIPRVDRLTRRDAKFQQFLGTLAP